MGDMVDTAMARGLLMPRLLPTMAGEATVVMAMARGPLMPTTVATDMERGLLMPRLLPTMAGEVMEVTAMARGLLTPRLTTVVMDMADTATARGPLMPTMAAMDMADTAMANNCNVTFILNINWPKKLNRILN